MQGASTPTNSARAAPGRKEISRTRRSCRAVPKGGCGEALDWLGGAFGLGLNAAGDHLPSGVRKVLKVEAYFYLKLYYEQHSSV